MSSNDIGALSSKDFPRPGIALSDGLAGPGEAHPLQAKPKAPKIAKLRDLLNTPQPATETLNGAERAKIKIRTG
jgi:hypothetical protein